MFLKKRTLDSFDRVTLRLSGMRLTTRYELVRRGDEAVLTEFEIRFCGGGDELLPRARATFPASEALALLNACGVAGWDGFSGEHPKGVTDGTMFSLTAQVDGARRIRASGSENFPRGFYELEHGLNDVLRRGTEAGCAEQIRTFGVTAAGETVQEITLDNGILSCRVITLGAALRVLRVPDRDGMGTDVVLGYDTLAEYERSGEHFGATVGRVANRIALGRFTLNGRTYTLPRNEGEHHLHGGPGGFTFRVWTVEEVSPTRLVLSLTVPDGDQGYPGELTVRSVYELDGASLTLRHEAESKADTVCSMTNHSYFNLSGHDSGSIADQTMTLFADRYAPIAPDTLPLGTLEPVAGTPMDFTSPAPLGPRADAPFEQLRQIGGFDHSYEVRGPIGTLRPAARAVSPRTGIIMEAETTLPAVHLFTTNDLAPGTPGKGGARYDPRQAFCLETQFFPNSPNVSAFPSIVLRPGQPYSHATRFTFSATENSQL